MEKIRIGFVGCGQFARNFVPLFSAHPAVEYVAVCDKFRERAEDYMERFGCDEIFDTYDEEMDYDYLLDYVGGAPFSDFLPAVVEQICLLQQISSRALIIFFSWFMVVLDVFIFTRPFNGSITKITLN